MIRYQIMPERAQAALDSAPYHRYVLDDGTVWSEFYHTDDRYLLRFPKLADFEVSADGTKVTAHPVADVDEATVEHLYINQLVPLALSRQGKPAFHASVVTVPGGAVAFLGKTGMGKSTLAASFALQDAAFLTDDALLVSESEGQCFAEPSHASLRLWEDSVDALISSDTAKAAAISFSTKARLLAGDTLTYVEEQQPLVAAFVLDWHDVDDVVIDVLEGVDRYMAWLSNSFLLDIEDNSLLTQHFEWTHRVAESVPTFALDYPRDYGMLPGVRRAVRQHVANIGSK